MPKNRLNFNKNLKKVCFSFNLSHFLKKSVYEKERKNFKFEAKNFE